MQLANQISENDVVPAMNFYKTQFSHVAVITCLSCNTPLAFELAGSLTGDLFGFKPNDLGQIIIPVGNHLLSSRVRLDEHHLGQRMMGYHCGAPVPNPKYPQAKKDYEKALATYDKEFKKADLVLKKSKDQSTPPPYIPPQLIEPETTMCNNDTRIAEVEIGAFAPVGVVQPGAAEVGYSSPFEKHKASKVINESPPYPPDFEEHGNVRRYETFRVEKVI